MSTETALPPAADAAAGEATSVALDDSKTSLPVRKRVKTDDPEDSTNGAPPPETSEPDTKRVKTEETDEKAGGRPHMSKAREVRLEQNRKAARESRRRKKIMIEELQRSVIFFSRANGTLKQQNDELGRLLMQAQAQINAIESGQQPAPAPAPQGEQQTPAPAPSQDTQAEGMTQQAQANAVATQAMYESQGFPSAAARAAAQTMNAGTSSAAPADAPVPSPAPAAAPGMAAQLATMQTGSTMQAMANFQQAAAAAMQAAMTMNPHATAAATVPANTPQAYADTLNALAIQQAAGAQFAFLPQLQQGFLAHPAMAQMWGQQQQQQQQQPQQQPAPAPVQNIMEAPAAPDQAQVSQQVSEPQTTA